ncbi:hypothetical protein [Streptomyces chartreusis]|uniref:hypothetical protein n=1 Tax=Streptomyces chartreusis TaxID=1969 RepID=UPI00167AC23D|nr:hypothetical protein [Streptomyces chartreusis]GGX56196.1 hypothetical protein GCM10010321_86830 [Streptomyces chartreusis]
MTTQPRSPRLLLLSTVLFAIAGIALLSISHGQEQPAPASITQATTGQPAPAATAPPSGTAPTSAPAAPPRPTVESALPPHGDGPASDQAVQQALEAAWPADLPAADERVLVTAGRALLRADATGIGRARWPNVFSNARQGIAPAFATARFRIQAVIARRDGAPNQAVVHLVWAGQDRGGTYTDLRITDLSFTRAVKKGTVTWTPQPRT